jgi:glycosyltransferase involved in cell wall biosynthesis
VTGADASVLGVDGHRLADPESGVVRYLRELLREWSTTALPFHRVVLYVPRTPEPGLLPDGHPFEVRVLSRPRDAGLWLHWRLGRAASRETDLLFCPSFESPLLSFAPAVVTIHDALPAFRPAAPWSVRRDLRRVSIRLSARRAREILTVSESSKRDIVRWYGVRPDRVHVVPLAAAPSLAEDPGAETIAALRRRHGLDNAPLCLFVGKLTRRRNLPVLIEAFAEARRDAGSDHLLVLAGSGGDGTVEGPHVRRLGQVSEIELRALYHTAEVFVYPSTYEGFGLPVLEAMAAGVPVLTVENSSLAEVAGGAALLISEPTRGLIAGALVRLFADPALRADLAARGRARASEFSWRRTAAQTLERLVAAAEGAPRR